MQPPSHFAEPDDTHLPVALRARARAVARRVDLVPDCDPPLRFSNVTVRRDDKSVFDSYSAFAGVEMGRRLRQWDVFTLVLNEALENPSGRFAAWSRWRSGSLAPR